MYIEFLLVTPEVTEIIIQGLVFSKLDYCNGLLLGVSNHKLNKLQTVRDRGCRVPEFWSQSTNVSIV